MPTIIYEDARVDCDALERLLKRQDIDALAYYKDPGGVTTKGLKLHVQVPLDTDYALVSAAVDRLSI